MVSFGEFLNIARYNVKILFGLNIVAAIVLTLLTPVFFSLSLLSFAEMAKIGELYLCTCGIILFTHLANIEDGSNSSEIVYIRRTPHTLIFYLRVLFVGVLTFSLILGVAVYAMLLGSSFPLWKFSAGVWISAVFFGSIALTVANLTGEVTAGYLVSFAYYFFEWVTKGKYTGNFFVLSLLNNSFAEKYRILALIIILIILNLVLIYRKS